MRDNNFVLHLWHITKEIMFKVAVKALTVALVAFIMWAVPQLIIGISFVR